MTDLVFVRAASPVQGGPIDLVFGASSGPAIPSVQIEGGGEISGLRGSAQVRAVVRASSGGQISGLFGAAEARWDANVSRSTRAELVTAWQEAKPMARGLSVGWQEAAPARGAVVARWQEAEALRAAVGVRWQEASPLRGALAAHWQETERLRAAVGVRWQEGIGMRAALRTGHGDALAVRVALQAVWQEAMRPPAGVSAVVVPGTPPCYKPGPPVELVFRAERVGGLPINLVFRCFGSVAPPAGVIVLPRRSYIVINSVEIRRADSPQSDPLPSESFSMQLDRKSWTWSFNATFHKAAYDAVALGPNGEPVELEVKVNGVPFRMIGERTGPSRRLAEGLIRVSGRGRSAVLAEPNSPVMTFKSALTRTANQLMTDVLTVNGVGIGWSVDFGLSDWLVPGGAWLHQGTHITALSAIAAAAGGYLQPHNTDQVIRVLPAWPRPWWEWSQLVPDIDLPAGLSEIDDTEIIDRPLYNRIFVAGESFGVTADLTRSGTGGGLLKQPMVMDRLITGLDVAKQRARAELSESGRALMHKMTLPVLPQTGVIKPGVVLRYYDHASNQRTGIVRSTSVAMQFPVLTQSLEVESHA